MGEGKGASGALYRALATGKPKTVDWLTTEIPADTQTEPEAVLEQLFGDLDVLIGSNHKNALEAYLDSLPQQRRDRVNAHFTSGLIVIPQGFQQVMKERGLMLPEAVEKTPGPVKKNRRHQKVTMSPSLDSLADPYSLDKNSNILISSVKLGLSSQVSALLSTPAGQALATKQDSSGKNALMYASLYSPMLHALSFYGPRQSLQPGRRPEAAATPGSKPSGPGTELLDIKFTNQLLALTSAQMQARAIDNDGNNALMHAITSHCFVNARQLLLLPSADEQAGIRDKEGRNAMMLAVIHGELTVFGWLLELPSGKAQLRAVDGKGRNAIDYMWEHLDGEERERLLGMAGAVLNPGTD
jgi:ankyrin repeat protein